MTAAEPQAQTEHLFSMPEGSHVDDLELALDAVEVGIFEYDPVSRTHRFSERCNSICGFAVDEDVTAERVMERTYPDDRHLAAAVLQALEPGGPERYSIEHRIVLPDGSIRWVMVCGRTQLIEGPDGRRAVRGYGAMLDITRRKVAEQQLFERNSQLRAFVECAPVPIAILDRDMRYVAVSHRYAEDRQRSAADLVGRSLYEVFPELPEHWRQVHRSILRGASERCDNDLFVQPDGSYEWVRWEMRPWYGADSEVGGVLLFAELITERLKAQQTLRDSQARLELVVQAGALGVYEYDFTARQANWDARLRQLFGFGRDEAITYEMFLQGIHPDDRARVDQMADEATRAGGSGILDVEFRVVNRIDGSIRWLASTGRVYIEDGHIMAVGVMRDISDRKRTELALERSAEELRRADHRKNVYLATLAHELRNPLAPIRTAAHLLTSSKLTLEQLKWVSGVIHRQTGLMARLLDDLLDITRICRGQLTLCKERVPVAGIATAAIESARPMIDEKRHRLLVSLPHESFTVHADAHRLSQVLSNLLTNAAKYTDPGGQIELSVADEEGDLVMRVKDNGIGMSREALDKIFTMFWQADSGSAHSQGGLGIGLSFVEGVVHLHGGTVEARSEGPGHGSELIVRLPVIERSAHEGAAVPPFPLAGAGPLVHRRILVAEDERDTADTLERLLTLSRHEVRVARSGPEAVRVAREFRPDVALLDLAMPGLDGHRLARTLRQEPWAHGLRLIALTGWGQPDILRHARESGFDEHVIKPVDAESLRRVLS